MIRNLIRRSTLLVLAALATPAVIFVGALPGQRGVIPTCVRQMAVIVLAAALTSP